MKNNEINYKGLNKDRLSVLKRNQIKNKNIDTIILDRYNYNGSYEKNNEFKNIKNIIINNKKLRTNPALRNVIEIQNTKAENIYFLNKESNSGLTYPIEMGEYELHLLWKNENICNLKEINIVVKTKTERIKLNEDVKEIRIYPFEFAGALVDIRVYIKTKFYEKTYGIDVTYGMESESYDKYEYNELSIKNGVLDLRDINQYKDIYCEEMKVDTLIINKEIINNVYFKNRFDKKLNITNLKIIDENEMKLNPIKEIILDDILEIQDNYLLNSKHTKVIFLDKDNNIKIIDKEELLKDNKIEKVDLIFNSKSNLVIIKYKNNEYKIIDKYNEYNIDKIFNKFLLLNLNSYNFKSSEKTLLEINIKDKDYFSIFSKGIINNNLLYIIYKDYIDFMKRLVNLNKLGFSYEAINYLVNKKYENIINTKSRNILNLDNISQDEINSFNELGEKYKETKKLIKK